MNIWDIVISCIILVMVAWAVVRCVRLGRSGGCASCGDCASCAGVHESTAKRLRVSDRNKSHYPYKVGLAIGGMTCDMCARKVENALNSLDGVWARVSVSDHSADVLLKSPPDESMLKGAVSEAGYVVTSYTRGD